MGAGFNVFPATKVNTTPTSDVFAFTTALKMMLHYLVLEGYLAGPYGNAVPNRPCFDNRTAGSAATRWRLCHRHFGRGIPGGSGTGGAARTRDHGKGPARLERPLRKHSVPNEHAHGRHDCDRTGGAADAGAAGRLGGLQGVQTLPVASRSSATSDQQWTRFVEEFRLQELAADPCRGRRWGSRAICSLTRTC